MRIHSSEQSQVLKACVPEYLLTVEVTEPTGKETTVVLAGDGWQSADLHHEIMAR